MKIKAKIVTVFLFTSLGMLVPAGCVFYYFSFTALKAEIYDHLDTAVQSRAHHIETVLKMYEQRARLLTSKTWMRTLLKSYLETNDVEYKTKIEGVFVDVQAENPKFLRIFITNPEGQIIISTDKEIIGKDISDKDYFINAKKEHTVSDFDKDDTGGIRHHIAGPIIQDGEFLGIVSVATDGKILEGAVAEYAGLGETGESYLVNKNYYMISPSRFEEDTFLKQKVDTEGARECFLHATLSKEKIKKRHKEALLYPDYRDRWVLGAHAYISEMQWALLAEIDEAEAFAPIKNLRYILIITGTIILFVIGVISIFVGKTISNPVSSLQKGTVIIGSGNLNYKVGTEAKDEIGQLSRAFDQMTENLKTTTVSRDKLEEKKQELEKVNKELDSFVYTASHDLRAPLRAILAYSTFLEKDCADKLDERGKKDLKAIRECANKMTDLIDDLLLLSRISRIRNPHEEVDINDLIDSVKERIAHDIEIAKGGLNVQKNLPVVKCDRIKIAEVFLNLISNAIKFSSKDIKENPKVEVGYADKGEFHQFYVKDNGIGIEPQYHKQIFDIFNRLHGADEYDGTGAGLSIVKRVVGDYGGNIWVESEIGKGATFYFTIPKELTKKKRIGEILVADGLITKKKLQEELQKQKDVPIEPPEYKGKV